MTWEDYQSSSLLLDKYIAGIQNRIDLIACRLPAYAEEPGLLHERIRECAPQLRMIEDAQEHQERGNEYLDEIGDDTERKDCRKEIDKRDSEENQYDLSRFRICNSKIYPVEHEAQQSYLDNDGKPIFSTIPMSFRNKHTGQIDSAWVAHFAQYGVPIPEGVEGTNPSQMSLDTVIRIVYKYY